jgi:quercetin dioxygenase-like cupin family protein
VSVSVVRKAGEAQATAVDKAVRTEIEWLIDRHDGAPNFELRKFSIKPGGSIPRHYHPDIEHEQFVLSGDYEVGIGETVYKVKPGDSLYIPLERCIGTEISGPKTPNFSVLCRRKKITRRSMSSK